MEYILCGKRLVVAEGITEIRYGDLCEILGSAEPEEVCLPETVEKIHNDAFFDFPSIKRINIPPNVQYIGSQAFWGLDALEELTLPIAVPAIGYHAFCNCPNLTLTIVGDTETFPAGWDTEFAANIKQTICRPDLL